MDFGPDKSELPQTDPRDTRRRIQCNSAPQCNKLEIIVGRIQSTTFIS